MKSDVYGSFIADTALSHRLVFWCAGSDFQYQYRI